MMAGPQDSGRLRVLHVVFSLDAGGMENGVVNVANRLAPDHDVHVACIDLAGRMATRLGRPDRVHVLGRGEGFSLGATWRLARCLRRVRPHVLHTHNLGPLIYGGLASGFGSRVPVFHGEHAQFDARDLHPRRLRQRRFFYRCAREIHTVSEGQVRELAAHRLGTGKVRAILNGVDTDRFLPGDGAGVRAQLGIPPGQVVLGIVSRFGAHKRHELLVDAFERLRSAGLPVQLVVVGAGGPEEARIRARCQSSREAASIHWMGFSGSPERLYPLLDLLVVPSVNEGLSNVVLEAMACGRPALSHGACGSSELIESGVDGWVADLSTPERLAMVAARLIEDPAALRRLGRNAREKVVARFSLERMSREYAAAYRGLVAR